MLIGADLVFPADRVNIFLKTFSFWDTSSLGFANPRMLAWSFPNGAFLGFSAVVGLSLESAEKIWFYFLFAFSGLSMYFLATTIAKNNNRYAIGVIAAFFYMFNPYIALGITNWPYLWLTYASLPLVLGLFIKGITERRGIKYVILVNLIWWVTSSSQYVNPKYALLNWLPLFLYLIFYILTSKNRNDLFHSIRFTGLLLGLWALFNIYWILPTISYISQIIMTPGGLYSAIGRGRLADFGLNSAPLSDAMRLTGSWIFHSGWMGYPYLYWGKVYSTSLFVFIGYLIPVIAFIPLLFKREKTVLFFSLFLVASLLLMSGNLPPFGKITMYFISHIPLLIDVFSLPYPIFGLYATLGFAALFGYGVILLSNFLCEKNAFHLQRKLKLMMKALFVGITIFLVMGVYAFPLWTGEVAYPGNDLLSSSRYKIPDYYYDASNWLSSDVADFRLYSLPYSIIGYASYAWEPSGYQGLDPTASLLGRSVVASSVDSDLSSVIAKLVVSKSTVEIAMILALMNVKYIVFHNDINWKFLDISAGQAVVSSYISTSSQNFKAILASQDGFSLWKSFGQLDFYRNNYWQPNAVYVASTNILSEGNIMQLIKTTGRTDFVSNESVITFSNQLNQNQISALELDSVFIQNPSLSGSVSNFSSNVRIVNTLDSQPFLVARFYSGWKNVVNTMGLGYSDALNFQSPAACPYIDSFPFNFTNWNALNSSMVYIKTGSSPLTIFSVQSDGNPIVSLAFWETSASWETFWPVVIPANQKAIIQVTEQADRLSLQTDIGLINLQVLEGRANPPPAQTSSEISSSVLIHETGNYILAIKVVGNNYGDILVKIDNRSFSLDGLSKEHQPASAYKYIGPINLTAGNHVLTPYRENSNIENSSLQIESMMLYSLKTGESFVNAENLISFHQPSNASITYNEINPNQYTVHVNSSQPFYLVLSQSYDNGWVATINGQQVPDQYHFTANGYANGWYINKTGTYTITLEFEPQNLFYVGAAISIIALIVCTAYVSKNTIKNIYKKYLQKVTN